MEHDCEEWDEPSDPSADEVVGYGRPPRHRQWTPGTSGNPKGRPRQAKGRKAILERIAFETCQANIGGKLVIMMKVELVLFAVRNAAANGDPAGHGLFDRLLRESREEGPPIPKASLIAPERLNLGEWDEKYGPH